MVDDVVRAVEVDNDNRSSNCTLRSFGKLEVEAKRSASALYQPAAADVEIRGRCPPSSSKARCRQETTMIC